MHNVNQPCVYMDSFSQSIYSMNLWCHKEEHALVNSLGQYCTQHVSKFGKLSSNHRTGKGQFSFRSQRRAMPKNVQLTIQLCSFHMLARLCSKFFKLGFGSMWIENFHMYKLGFEETEEPEIKFPTFVGSWRKQGVLEKMSTSASLTMLKLLTAWITTNCRKFLRRWRSKSPYLSPEKPEWRSRSIRQNQTQTNILVLDWGRSTSRLYIITLLI